MSKEKLQKEIENIFNSEKWNKFQLREYTLSKFQNLEQIVDRIMQSLPELIHEHEFKPLQRYLANNPHPLKQYQLAAKIAEVFDQYLVFRPEMISQWESGKDRIERKMPTWQALLWRRITADIETPHPARMQVAWDQFKQGRVAGPSGSGKTQGAKDSLFPGRKGE